MSPRRTRRKEDNHPGGTDSPENQGAVPENGSGIARGGLADPAGRQPPEARTTCAPSETLQDSGTCQAVSLEAARARAGEWILEFAHRKLLAQADEVAVAARALLAAEGVAWEGVSRLPVGVLGGLEECETAFCRDHPAQKHLAEYWLKDPRVAEALIGCVRDATGSLVTLWARPIHVARPALLCRRAWQETVGVYGVDVLAQLRPPHVLAVERLTDALALQSHGLEPVIAFGRRFDEVPVERWAELLRWGVVQITLLPAGPMVSKEVFRNVRRRLWGVGRCPEVWVLPTRRVTLGLGRLVSLLGRKEFLELVRHHRVALVGRKQLFRMQAVAARSRGFAREGERTEPAEGLPSTSEADRSRAHGWREKEADAPKAPGAPPAASDGETPASPADWLDFD